MAHPNANPRVQCEGCRSCGQRKGDGTIRFTVPVLDPRGGGEEYRPLFSVKPSETNRPTVSLVELRDSDGRPMRAEPSLRNAMSRIVGEMNKTPACGAWPQCPHELQDGVKKSQGRSAGLQDLVRAIPYFRSLTSEARDILVKYGRVIRLRRKECLYHDGSPNSGFYALLRGTIKIYRTNWEGRQTNLITHEPGDVFGEESALGETPHVGTAEAISEVSLLRVPSAAFQAMIEKDPVFTNRILQTISEKVTSLYRAASLLTSTQSTARIAHFLDERLRKDSVNPIRLRLPKFEIASLIGIAPETLSRGLRKLQVDGVIDVTGNAVLVRDPEALHTLAICG